MGYDQWMTFLQHHWVLVLLLVLVCAAWVVLEVKERTGALRLSPADVTLWINRKNALVVDLRARTLFEAGHISGALLFTLDELKGRAKVYQSRSVVLVDAQGRDALTAARELSRAGWKEVAVLAGGVAAWLQADLPLVRKS